ncbi:uncharacterized protein [Fopius arisanus]|uniref:Uncharacterized protein n=2 Tax=Fopius arisanus TaxID=64838 RepID=A0A9R1STG3_9HYME|nr:PREDICTED: uncharacterized protein LOC105262771 [Fopius arisanus]
MKFRSWRESRECYSDDEKIICKTKRRKSLCPSVNWNLLHDRQPAEIAESSASQMSVALLGVSTSTVTGYEELNSKFSRFTPNDFVNINLRALEHEGLIHIMHSNKLPEITVDIRKLRLNMAVVNTWNEMWLLLPKEGFIEKKRKLRRVCRCISSKKENVAIGRQLQRTEIVINPCKTFSTEVHVQDDPCKKLNELSINSDPVTDHELASKMSTLSCSQNSITDRGQNQAELLDEWKMFMADFLIDRIDGEISNLNINEIDNDTNNEIPVIRSHSETDFNVCSGNEKKRNLHNNI